MFPISCRRRGNDGARVRNDSFDEEHESTVGGRPLANELFTDNSSTKTGESSEAEFERRTSNPGNVKDTSTLHLQKFKASLSNARTLH